MLKPAMRYMGRMVFSLALILGVSVFSSLLFAAEKPKQDNLATGDSLKFLPLRLRLLDKIRDSERQNINFAVAEYYFWDNDFIDAQRDFQDFVAKAPVGINSLLGNVYLYKIAHIHGNEKQMEAIKKDLFQNRFILLFDKFKTLTYASLWKNEYEVHYFVDRIEIFLNGEIFEEIKP